MSDIAKAAALLFLFLVAQMTPNTILAGDADHDDGNQKPGFFQLEQMRFHVAKGGAGWMKITFRWAGKTSLLKDFDMDSFDFLAEYGLKNRKICVCKTASQEMQVVSQGEFEDILQFVRVLDSGVPFLLWRDDTFEVRWDGNVFALHMEFKGDGADSAAESKDGPSLIITTDGKFRRSSIGRISEKGSKITIESSKELSFEIEGLAE